MQKSNPTPRPGDACEPEETTRPPRPLVQVDVLDIEAHLDDVLGVNAQDDHHQSDSGHGGSSHSDYSQMAMGPATNLAEADIDEFIWEPIALNDIALTNRGRPG